MNWYDPLASQTGNGKFSRREHGSKRIGERVAS